MVIDDKYLGLLGTYIYDKRTKMHGIISDLCVMGLPNGYTVYYNAYMNSIRSDVMICVEDFESGNVVFLEPFGIVYMEKEMKEIEKRHRKAIVDFFGDKFREGMIVRISESERQKKIKEWERFTYALKEWGTTEIGKQIPMEHHHTKIFEISGKARESICPSCLGSIVTHEKEYPEFCVWCGQKIDW